ncbi:MAG: biotin--[acetyl-CoA-carboxylase] ligase [Candidatus Neomarinimicrobiota bacterium]
MFNLNLYKNNLATDFIGQVIKYYRKIDSTNTKAWELISKNTPNGTVIISDNQLKGRGRQSNKWISIPGKSLTFSIIMYPNYIPNQINLYSLFTGLAIIDCLTENNIQAQLKWPNDILINVKKVGGILCESKISGGVIKSLVIGIGLNVNENITELPESLRKNTTSLMIENGIQYQLEILLANILNHLEHRIKNQNETYLQIVDWEKYCAHLGQKVTFHTGNEIVTGIFKGLTETGQAIITINNKEVNFDSGEIID